MLSIVVPVLNESHSLTELAGRVDSMAKENQLTYEMIFVDDGSSDDSWRAIAELARSDARRRGIRFRRNFGKAAALTAGFEAAQGDWIVTMDADLQDDPVEVPAMLAKLNEGFDVVSGWKKERKDPWHKVWPSWFFNRMVSRLTGVRLHDHNCGLKLYRRAVFEEVRIYGELHRFIPVLAASRGFRVTEVPVRHHPRVHGVSKYGVTRFFKGFLDLLTVYFLTGFRQRPQHLLGFVGILCFFTGLLGLAGLSLGWVVTRVVSGWTPIHLHERAIFYFAIVGLLLGVQLLSMGFLAELIIASSRSGVSNYSISERTEA